MRTVFLRHHRGALNVLPYGEIKRLRNTSRDWMIMVMEFRLTYDTDIKQVKKIMKKIGEEIAADPDYAPGHAAAAQVAGRDSRPRTARWSCAPSSWRGPGGNPFMIRRVAYEKIIKAFRGRASSSRTGR